MVEMSNEIKKYFSNLQNEVDKCYEIAENARKKGLDPEIYVESPQAKDLAGRVEKLVGPEGVADLIRKLKNQGKGDDEIVFQVVSDVLDQKVGNIETMEERVEANKQQECVHHWIIETACSPMSWGKCKHCGRIAEFHNTHTNEFVTHDKLPVKQLASMTEESQ